MIVRKHLITAGEMGLPEHKFTRELQELRELQADDDEQQRLAQASRRALTRALSEDSEGEK